MAEDIAPPSTFGGLLFPLDMFRPSSLAAVLAEGLVSQAKNILDAKLVITRHPEIQVLIARIVGSVVGPDEARFWRENVELGLVASQVLPRQLFVYYVVEGGPLDARQGFIVAQRGQVLAAEDATADQLPPDALPEDWPVERLLAQLGLPFEDLAGGFHGGPSIELSLVEGGGDDREMLMTLAAQPGPAPAATAQPSTATPSPPKPASPKPTAAEAPGRPKRITVEEDQKRRAAEQQAASAAREAKAVSVRSDLPYVVDELGVVVAPRAELADTDILRSFVVGKLSGELPVGLPPSLQDPLQGKRIDFVAKVEFLSEVFSEEGPLSKPTFEAKATSRTMGGHAVRVLEVLAPRLGKGTLVRRERAGAFISRTPDLPLPEGLIIELLDRQV